MGSLEGNSAVASIFFNVLSIWEECTPKEHKEGRGGLAVVKKMNLQEWFCCKGEPKVEVEYIKDKALEIKVARKATGIWKPEWFQLGDTWDITIYAQLLQGLKDIAKALVFKRDAQPHTQLRSCSLIPSTLFLTSSGVHPCTCHVHGPAPTSLPMCYQGHRLWLLSCMVPNALSSQLIPNH